MLAPNKDELEPFPGMCLATELEDLLLKDSDDCGLVLVKLEDVKGTLCGGGVKSGDD